MIDMLADPESFSKLHNWDHSSFVKTSHFGHFWRIEDNFSHKICVHTTNLFTNLSDHYSFICLNNRFKRTPTSKTSENPRFHHTTDPLKLLSDEFSQINSWAYNIQYKTYNSWTYNIQHETYIIVEHMKFNIKHLHHWTSV